MNEYEEYPKVFVGTITFDGKEYIAERFIERVKELTYPGIIDFIIIDTSRNGDYYQKLKKLVGDFGTVLKDPYYEDTRENCCKARNHLVDLFLKSDAEYMFHLEQDVIPKKDIIEELIQWKKPIVGGWYYINQGREFKRACIFKGWLPIKAPDDWLGKQKNLMKLVPYDTMGEKRLMKVYLGALGIILIHRDIFEKHGIRFWWAKEFSWHDDTGFFHDLEVKGIDFFVDTDCLVPHFQSYWAVERFEKMKRMEMEVNNNG